MGRKTLNAPMASPPHPLSITPMPSIDKTDAINKSGKKPENPSGVIEVVPMAGYSDRVRLFDFLAMTYEGGPLYKFGRDARGDSVLIEHEQEYADTLTKSGAISPPIPTASEMLGGRSEASLRTGKFRRRQRFAIFENYVKPIVTAYSAYIGTAAVNRPEDEEIRAEIERIELETHIDEMIEDGLRFSETWIGFDAKPIVSVDGRTITEDEAWRLDPKNGGRPYIIRHDPRCVIDYTEENGTITRVVFVENVKSKDSLVSPEKVVTRYREWTASSWTLYELEEKNGRTSVRVVASGVHRLGVCPFRRVTFPFPISDLAEANRQHFNLGSILDEENVQNTFSQRVVTGLEAKAIEGTDRGAGNTIVLPDADADMKVISGDPRQAEVLMKRREAIVASMYEMVGVTPIGKNVAESAEKKKRDLEKLYTYLGDIVEEIERAENWLLVSMEIYPEDDPKARTGYSREFDVYSADEIIAQLDGLSKTAFAPAELKRRLAVALAQRLDPFGPHGVYKEQAEGMFDASAAVVESAASLRREGVLTPEMLVELLSVPDSMKDDLIEMMSHVDETGAEPVDPNDGGEDGGSDGMPGMQDGEGGGAGGGGDVQEDDVGPGSGSPGDSGDGDGSRSTTNGGKDKARRVRRPKPGSSDK